MPNLLSRVKGLMEHPDFTLKNPNRLRSVISSFASSQKHFHAKDGSGYKFLGDMVLEVDKLNPQVCLLCIHQWRYGRHVLVAGYNG